jgi:hypothetical protein
MQLHRTIPAPEKSSIIAIKPLRIISQPCSFTYLARLAQPAAASQRPNPATAELRQTLQSRNTTTPGDEDAVIRATETIERQAQIDTVPAKD